MYDSNQYSAIIPSSTIATLTSFRPTPILPAAPVKVITFPRPVSIVAIVVWDDDVKPNPLSISPPSPDVDIGSVVTASPPEASDSTVPSTVMTAFGSSVCVPIIYSPAALGVSASPVTVMGCNEF